jgi:hypothetical protein
MIGSFTARAVRVFFVVSYIVATITVAHDRSVHVADRFHSISSAGPSIRPPCGHVIEALPQFSHAKKPRPFVVGVLPAAIHRTVCFVETETVEQHRLQYKPSLFILARNTRAPPPLT